MSAIRSDKTPSDAATDVVGEFLVPYVGEQMLAASIVDSLRNTTRFGGQIYNDTDDDLTKWEKSLWHISKTLRPGTINRVEKRIIPAFRDNSLSMAGTYSWLRGSQGTYWCCV